MKASRISRRSGKQQYGSRRRGNGKYGESSGNQKAGASNNEINESANNISEEMRSAIGNRNGIVMKQRKQYQYEKAAKNGKQVACSKRRLKIRSKSRQRRHGSVTGVIKMKNSGVVALAKAKRKPFNMASIINQQRISAAQWRGINGGIALA